MEHPRSLGARSLGDRDRFVGFAFAAADLLVEVDAEGRIGFAAGAFRHRLNREPEAVLGKPADLIIAPEDRQAFALALALLPDRGRLPPTAFRLNDAARTAFAVGGLSLARPDGGGRLCLTFAPLPVAPCFPVPEAAALAREAAQRLRAGEGARLSLLSLPEEDKAVAEALPQLLARDIEGGFAARLGPGRYGLLHAADAAPPDPAALGEALAEVLGRAAPEVSLAADLSLDASGLTPVQTVRALRHGLASFARLGADGLGATGFQEGLRGVVGRIAQRAGRLRAVVADHRFRLEFQPIVNLRDRAIHHYEALFRPAPEALLPGEGPQDFFRLAETVGLTEDIDLAVARVALATLPAVPQGRHLAFNISGLSAQSPGFRARRVALLGGQRRAKGRLMVELTESAEIQDEAAASETLRTLRALGVPVCLDDFGAGAAAFRYLKAFPVDYVKLDGSFVTAAIRGERDRSFIASMVDLSRAVGARVVAEHVETEECAALMLRLGVDFGQGWLFGRPGPL